ncbi:hypothetical protein AB4Y36_38305 [Paraburkholderia sp. BR10936]|uniref:hypothetical protein n=1 Tax=Paraburkholderia sp. BR10936 TaxID=3236993 RepID=UPI0034D28635
MSKSLNYATPSRPNGIQEEHISGAERFAAGADTHHAPKARAAKPAPVKPGELDWMARPHDREISLVNVRLTDREKGALQWLSERSPDSMHTICKRVVKAEINRLLREAGVREIGELEK